MPAYSCVFCGKPISSAEAANELDLVCAACKSTQAIATAEDAVKAKVTPIVGAIGEGESPVLQDTIPSKQKPGHYALFAIWIMLALIVMPFVLWSCYLAQFFFRHWAFR